MKRFLRWFVFAPIGALLILFLVANRELVALSLDPFSTIAPSIATPALPLRLWLALALTAGFALGLAASWMSGRELRIRAKADRLELAALKTLAKAAPPEPLSP